MESAQDPIGEFLETAIRYGEAMKKPRPAVANKHQSKLDELYSVIRGDPKLSDQVVRLFDHEDGYVRLNAAICLLPIAPAVAERTLDNLSATERRNLGFIAMMTLKEWRKGTLKF